MWEHVEEWVVCGMLPFGRDPARHQSDWFNPSTKQIKKSCDQTIKKIIARTLRILKGNHYRTYGQGRISGKTTH
jgi:hypothetical protein